MPPWPFLQGLRFPEGPRVWFLAGAPQANPVCPLDPLADTIVERSVPALPPGPIPIELIQLNLVSVNPITVTYSGGGLEHRDVRDVLGPQVPVSGPMTGRHDFLSGGTFSATLPVQPHSALGYRPPAPEAVGPSPIRLAG